MALTKPAVKPVWGETNTTGADMVEPTDPQKQAGWPLSVTPPSRQRWNWVLNYLMNGVRYLTRRGIADYDAAETYEIGDIVRGDDGLLRRSLVAANLNNTPSSSATQWGSPLVPTAAADDNTTKIATTAYVLGQLSSSIPLMDGTGAIGNSTRFARANHVHPSDSTKANTNGSYPSLSVGFATQAGGAPWSGITSRPTTVGGYGITDAIHTGNIGSQSVAFANSASRAYPRRSNDAAGIDIFYTGQPGQPNWLLGTNDGFNFYVWNPANFSVNYATYSDYSVTRPPGTSDTRIATTAFANPGQLQSVSGYVILPGGIMFQWGQLFVGDINPNPNVKTVVFPVAFSSIFNLQATLADPTSGNGGVYAPIAQAIDPAYATFYIREASAAFQNLVLHWMAIGV